MAPKIWLNVVEIGCHCGWSGLVRPIDTILRNLLSFERRKAKLCDARWRSRPWMIEIPLRPYDYHIHITTIWINEYVNCMWVVNPWMNKRPIFCIFVVCFFLIQPRKSILWPKKHVQQFTCNKIVYKYIDRENAERNTCSMFIFSFCTLRLYLQCSTHLLCCFVFFRLLRFFSFFFFLFLSISRCAALNA